MKESSRDIYINELTYANRNLNQSQIYGVNATRSYYELMDNTIDCDDLKLESSLKADKENIKILNTNKRPNRPFSYCIAMDCHPLDLSVFDSDREKNFNNNIQEIITNKSILSIAKKMFIKKSRKKESYTKKAPC